MTRVEPRRVQSIVDLPNTSIEAPKRNALAGQNESRRSMPKEVVSPRLIQASTNQLGQIFDGHRTVIENRLVKAA